MKIDELKRLLEKAKGFDIESITDHDDVMAACTELLRIKEGQEGCEHRKVDLSEIEWRPSLRGIELKQIRNNFCPDCGKQLKG